MSSADPLLSVRELSVQFRQRRGTSVVQAVDNVSFDISERETVALLGESGSGKSTIGNAILGLVPPTTGDIQLLGTPLNGPTAAPRRFRTKRIQMVFQDPYGSLDPSKTVGETLIEPLALHARGPKAEMRHTVEQMLVKVGLPADAARRYPVNFSGGQRQRIAIARAVISEPELVICDEPVSGLDLSIQAQVLNVLSDLQMRQGVAYLFISHDIAVVRRIAHRVLVLYRGQLVEEGTVDQVCESPRHPYTLALLLAAPVPDPAEQLQRRARRRLVDRHRKDEPDGGSGCPFAARCPFAIAKCRAERPPLLLTGSGSRAACHREAEVPDLMRELLDEAPKALLDPANGIDGLHPSSLPSSPAKRVETR